jgi:DNA-binding NtrC family response regulator
LSGSTTPVATAIVVAGDEETRVLLRGLLRLHHFRVEGEAEGATQALELVREHRPDLLVADVNLAEGSPMSLVAEARAVAPTLRVILVAPASRPPPKPSDPKSAPDVLLLRPFRIRQFAEAIAVRAPSVPSLEGSGARTPV